MMSEEDFGGMAVEIEPSHQYSITFCCCVTNGSRQNVTLNGKIIYFSLIQNF